MDPQRQPIAPSARTMVPPPEVLPSYAPKKFLYFSAFSFLAALLVYIGLAFGYTGFLESSITDLEEEMDTLSRQISPEQQEALARLYSQINNLQMLLGEHVETTGLFAFFEANTDPNTAYASVNVLVESNEINIEGVTDTYESLVSQLAIYEQAPEVNSFLLESSTVSDGVVRFKLNLRMTPDTFTPKL